ncbi:type II toxin-antitoxin system RelE/ParE family toxin [Azorhizobium doebereinerae]|uniref:type II toxin-antitoxin system RelE/ParE family toxin n=1 Tax=Azorhizobium doebereinerae TaxID=281091 RepID=UPI00048ECC1B|nr:type II toxin-antitoxin system RelE/ParE family toxin [Azorhizobium doebereinerae]
MPRLEWRERARADLLEIITYIADDNPDAARRLLDELTTKTARLAEHPKAYRGGRVPGTREITCGNYVVIYAEDTRAVTILRVLHGRRNWPPE